MTTEHSRTLVFRDVRVFDGAEVLPRQDVITQDGIVVQVRPTGSQIPEGDIVDGTGRTLLPGLVDAHLHLPPSPEAALRQLLELGVTTVFDMFSGGEVLDSINRIAATDPPHLASPFTSGTGATAPGSALEKMTRQPLPTVSHPRDAAAWVDARLREGSDYVKIIYDDREGGRLDLSTLKALIEAAHHRGARAVVHAITEQTAREAITAGADGLAHLFIGPDVSPDFGACAADHDVFVIPTLGVLRGMCGERPNLALAADPRLARYVDVRPPVPVRPADATRSHLYSAATAALAQLVTAHVRVLAGTDTGIPTAALGVFAYGATLHGELDDMVRAGLSPVQALIAATSAPAEAFGLADRGFIRPGMRADLLLVDGDPTCLITATRDIVGVWKQGCARSETRVRGGGRGCSGALPPS